MFTGDEFTTITELAKHEKIAPSYMTRVISICCTGDEIQKPGLHRQPEAGCDTGYPAGAAAAGDHQTGD